MHALEHVQNQLHALLQHHLPQPVAEKIFNALSTSTTVCVDYQYRYPCPMHPLTMHLYVSHALVMCVL